MPLYSSSVICRSQVVVLAGSAAFKPRVVVRAYPGELRHFLPPQAEHAPQLPISGDAGLFRGDLRAPRDQALTDSIFSVHIHHVTQAGHAVAVSIRHPHWGSLQKTEKIVR